MLKINKKYINKVVKNSLEEDLFPGKDITTDLLIGNPVIKAKIICNQNSVIGGLEFAKTAFKILDKKTKFIPKVKEGDKIKKGKTIAIINGKAKTYFKGKVTL